jgi:hypothetical protein
VPGCETSTQSKTAGALYAAALHAVGGSQRPNAVEELLFPTGGQMAVGGNVGDRVDLKILFLLAFSQKARFSSRTEIFAENHKRNSEASPAVCVSH